MDIFRILKYSFFMLLYLSFTLFMIYSQVRDIRDKMSSDVIMVTSYLKLHTKMVNTILGE